MLNLFLKGKPIYGKKLRANNTQQDEPPNRRLAPPLWRTICCPSVTCTLKKARVVALALPNLQLQGTISPSLANLSFLSVLNLQNNSFHGGIPYGIGHMPRLRVIDVKNNQLNGSIPTSLFQHRRIQVISLAFNQLSGEMWRGPWYVPKLRVLNLRNNSLTGTIPLSVGNATKMMKFSLSGNRVGGNIPKEIGNLSQLVELNLRDNQLTGSITAPLFNISSLLYLTLASNTLSGPLLLGEELKLLSISYNNITGDVPRNIGCLSKLQEFYIGDNLIKGTIPTSLGNISTLHNLNCGNNRIVGRIPPELGKLSNLRKLSFHHNSNLIGEIPEAIFNISSLEMIDFSFNNLSGRIPTTTGLHLPNLEGLYLGDNQLEGEIPLFITNASKLQIITLDDNSLTGTIPNNLGNLCELQILLLHTNQLTNEPRERDAHIRGLIPTSIGNMTVLTAVHIQGDNLIGSIPSDVGTIPKSLEKLSYLKSINVSSNDLEGEIQSGGVFANSTLQSFLGNKGLCGMHILEIPSCAITTPGKQSKLKEVLLKFVTPVVIASFLMMKRQKKGKSNDVEKGSSGSVYKGTLFGGTAVAIKVLDLENEQVCKRFDTECEVMRKVRHRNLVPVIATCSSDYIRALVLQFMPNGSLENWLYKEDRNLNLHQRVTVMFDAAMAVEYLHHAHVTPIVHCDLKPGNVLLDDDMVAHVGDFGISKILVVSKSVAHTETLGTLEYIAPEYGLEGKVSASGDVYSYGIMLMEVLSKRRQTEEKKCNKNLDLRKWITQSFSGTMMEVVDVNLFSEEEQITYKSEICIASMIELALDCTKETPESRITMKDVVKRLNKIKNTFLET
ncbi:hypothetical protein KY289_019994 [Solanum tuberosum]|nr:hypothetical protein KY289_019994 [Solanum tuberosum]